MSNDTWKNQKIEIADICTELEKLGRSTVFRSHTADACLQAAMLLKRMRELIITAPGLPDADGTALGRLKSILSEQGEG